MFRKILIGIGSLIVVGLISIIVFVQTVDVNKYLPQLTQQLGHSIGRKVNIQQADLYFSLTQGVSVDVHGISVGDNKFFSDQPFLRIDGVHCGVGLIPLLTKRQIAVSRIEIRAPKLTIIKNKAGKFNFESMIPESSDKPGSAKEKAEKSSPEKSKSFVLPLLLVNAFKIEGGEVAYMDRSLTPAMEFTVNKVDAQVIDFSLTDPFTIKLDAAVLSQEQNVHVKGAGRLDLRLQQARLDDFHFDMDISQVDLDQLNKIVPAVGPLGLQPGLRGTIQAVASQMVVGASGILVLSLEGQLSDGRIPMKILAQPIEQLSVKFDANESKIRVKEFSMSLSTGQVHGQANVKDYLTQQQFDLSADFDQLPLGEVLDQKKSPAQIKGSLSGSVKLNGHGFTPKDMDKITGQSAFSITHGELVNMNIVKMVLGRITIIPGLAQIVENQLSAEWQNKIGGKTIKIDKADVKTHIERSNVVVDDAKLQSQGFTMAAHGNVGFDQSLSMDAQLVLSKELSDFLISSAKGMKALVDEQGEIQIPVNISGKLSAPVFIPDMSYLGKRLLVNEGGDQLQKIFDKNPEVKQILDIFMGGKEDPPANQEQDGSSPTNNTDQSSGNKENSGQDFLNDLFKKGF